MANQVYGFFDSAVNDERDYSEIDMSRALHMIGGEGVTGTGDNLRVASAQDGLHVRVQYGRAMCQGYYYELMDDGGPPMTLAHEAALSLPRIDRVVLRLDRGIAARTVTLAVRQGTPSASPVPPALRRDDTVYELSLARVRVSTGAGLLNESDITDERDDETLCGILAPGRVEDLFSKLSAAAIATATPGENVQQALDSKLPKANVVNDLTTVNAGYALDARQGPVLMQAIGDAAGAVSGRVDGLEIDKMVNVYTHTRTGTVHNFTGTGPNGRALITAAFQPGDTFAVNGVAKPAYMGADLMDELPVGRWVSFTYDGSQINFKGGGAGLAVRVVGGTTQPVNPRENTIWVNTSVSISSFRMGPAFGGAGTGAQGRVFIGTRASDPLEPYVWLSGGKTGVLGKSDVSSTLVSCQQYDSGVWVNKAIRVFRGGVWRDTDVPLFRNGAWNPTASGIVRAPMAYTGAGVPSWGYSGTSVYISNPGGAGYSAMAISTNPVPDLTSFKRLRVTAQTPAWTDGSWLQIGFTWDPNSSDPALAAGYSHPGSTFNTYDVDISNLNGSPLFVIKALRANNGAAMTSYVHEAWLLR